MSQPAKLDRRIRRTQKLLGDALIALILEKGYDAITIKDITERADVAYVTFFRNYDSIEGLLKQRLEAVVVELIAQLETQYADHDAAREGTLIFEHVAGSRTLYSILFTSAGALGVVRHLKQTIASKVYTDCRDAGALLDNLPLEVFANHYASALLGLIQWWLENDLPYPPDRMGEIFSDLLINGTWTATIQQAYTSMHQG